ncbi:hypothetical protein ACFQ1L_28410 [Phytohabitans flavus]|uniref:hypothetical protein n=1 Tax=Phytohabitans flavus TaxID=1076124 RepID=UPI003630D60A
MTEQSPVHRLVGAFLLVPAFLALLWSYVLPTLSTVVESFRHGSFLEAGGPGAESAGFDNYDQALTDGFAGGLGTALLLALVPLLAALVAAPLLALAADRAGRAMRIATRVLLALPLALYAPAAVTVGWFTGRLGDGDADFSTRWPTVSVYAWISFGLVVAIAATAFLAALRGRRPGGGSGTALLAVGGVLALGVLATALQAATVPLLLGTRAQPPVVYAVVHSLSIGDFGAARPPPSSCCSCSARWGWARWRCWCSPAPGSRSSPKTPRPRPTRRRSRPSRWVAWRCSRSSGTPCFPGCATWAISAATCPAASPSGGSS